MFLECSFYQLVVNVWSEELINISTRKSAGEQLEQDISVSINRNNLTYHNIDVDITIMPYIGRHNLTGNHLL